MRRVLRGLYTFAAAVSLVLFVATAVPWARSFHTRMTYEFEWAGGRWEATCEGGRLWVDNAPQRRLEAERQSRVLTSAVARMNHELELLLKRRRPIDRRLDERRLDPEERRALMAELSALDLARGNLYGQKQELLRDPRWRAPTPVVGIAVPLGRPAAAAAVLPLAWLARVSLARRHRRVRLREGLCSRCSYDLRASPDRCPECGAATGRENKL